MAVGKMDILIQIQSATATRSTTTGQLVESWSALHSLWAEEMTKQSAENQKSSQLSSLEERTFRIRYISGITSKMRIYDAELARYYEITGIAPEGRKRYLLLTARSFNVNSPA